MMSFILVAILYCCAIFFMRKKYKERKIIKNDYGQRYEYHIFVGDNEFVGYSNYKSREPSMLSIIVISLRYRVMQLFIEKRIQR